MVQIRTRTVSSFLSTLSLALVAGCTADADFDALEDVEEPVASSPELEAGTDLQTSRHSLATNTTELAATQDTFVRSTMPFRAHGDQLTLRMRRNGNHRVLVQFDQAAIDAAVGDDVLVAATLVLPIDAPAQNWTPQGGTVDLHRMTTAWTDDATWTCPDDTDTSNSQADCTPGWELGGDGVNPYVAEPSASALVMGGDAGTLEFDVTEDVLAHDVGNGWLLRKTLPEQSGAIRFSSSESGAGPTLVVDVLVDECPDDPDKTEPGVCGCGLVQFEGGCFIPCPDYDDVIAHIEQTVATADDGGCIGALTMTCDGSTIAFSGSGGTYGEISGEVSRPGAPSGTAGGALYSYVHCEEPLGEMNAILAEFSLTESYTCQSLFDTACATLPAP